MSHLVISKACPIIENIIQYNRIFNFNSTDNEIIFNENKKKLGEEWYYYNKKIEYKYNSWGYRTKEFKDLEDDYILIFGCSFTEGIGLYYDDMWATKLSKELKLDVFNIGMGGTGVDFQFYNTTLIHNHIIKNNKPPKLVIYQWPFEHRTTYSFKKILRNNENLTGRELIGLSPFSISNQSENVHYFEKWYMHSFIENEGELIKQSNIYPMVCNNIWKSMGIDVINWTWENDFTMKKNELFSNDIELFNIIDTTNYAARDYIHNGHLSQNIIVDFLLNKINI
jgi:hypothetical protein